MPFYVCFCSFFLYSLLCCLFHSFLLSVFSFFHFTRICSVSFFILWCSFAYFVFLSYLLNYIFFHPPLCILSFSTFLSTSVICLQFQHFICLITLLFLPHLILHFLNHNIVALISYRLLLTLIIQFFFRSLFFLRFLITLTLLFFFFCPFFQLLLQNRCAKPVLASSCLSVRLSAWSSATTPWADFL